jgi:hypothetical protein
MSNLDEVQSQATEQALREENQQLRKQLEGMKTQIQALMANLEIMNVQMRALMETGERIETTLRSSTDSSEGSKKKEDCGVQHLVANTAGSSQFTQSPYRAPYRANYKPQARLPVYNAPPAPAPQVYVQDPNQQAPIQRVNNLRYPLLPVPQDLIYKQLVAEGLLSPVPAQPRNPPFPAWYNPNDKCAYHCDAAGHSTENCVRLRQKIYELINTGSIKLNPVEQEPPKANDQANVINVTPEESINFIGEDDQEIKSMHVTVIGDDLTTSNFWKISQEEEGPQSYTVAPVIFPEI